MVKDLFILFLQLFKGKKLIYPASVSQKFYGDYVGLEHALVSKWNKVKQSNPSLSLNEVHFADKVKKINRSDGDMAGRILVLSPSSLLVCQAHIDV